MKVKSLKPIVILVAVIALVCFAGVNTAPAAEPYHLGVALGLSGTGALYSKDQVEGITMAVDEINAKGGLLGKHPIKVFTRDDQTKPDVAVREVKDLILREKVQAVIASY